MLEIGTDDVGYVYVSTVLVRFVQVSLEINFVILSSCYFDFSHSGYYTLFILAQAVDLLAFQSQTIATLTLLSQEVTRLTLLTQAAVILIVVSQTTPTMTLLSQTIVVSTLLCQVYATLTCLTQTLVLWHFCLR